MESNDSDKNNKINIDSIVLVINQPKTEDKNLKTSANIKKLQKNLVTPRTI